MPGSGSKGNTGDCSTSVTPHKMVAPKQDVKVDIISNKRRTIDQVAGSKQEPSLPHKKLKPNTLMSYFQKKPAGQ